MTAGQIPAQRSADDMRQLEDEIAQTRERLGEAVEQLAAKLDVKRQARARAARIAGQVTGAAHRAAATGTKAARQRPVQLTAAAVAAAGLLLVAGAIAVRLGRQR